MEKDRIKVAVVGAGAAAFGVLSALLKKNDFDVVVFDIGETIAPAPLSDVSPNKFYNRIYKEIRLLHSFKFPPPKTHFARQIPQQAVGQRLKIFKSQSFGGLTNYWGATMLPFTDQEMARWPIDREALEPYYQRVAEVAGLAGRDDALNQYFIRDFSTRPPIRPIFMLSYLDEVVNRSKNRQPARRRGGFRIISGLNRCGLETREEHPNHCVYCGECMAGCFKDSVYSARQTIKKYLENPQIRYVKDRVVRVNKKNSSLEIETEKGLEEKGFDKIFLAAGCLHSTEIVMRSLGLRDRLTVADNAVYVFPILYLGKLPPSAYHQDYLSLCNIILGCIPEEGSEHFAQVQIYPNFDYLWRYNIPLKLWPIVRPIASFFRPRLFWGRLYLHSDYSQAYSIELKNDQLKMEHIRNADPAGRVKVLMSSIRKAVNHQGFFIPPISPLRQRVNSHYTSTIPYNGEKIKISSLGEIMPDVYVCDSSVFPEMPAINPGFTIMANAWRIADEATN